MYIVALAIALVFLGGLFYTVAIAEQGKKPLEVDVINLPIDEQGNLRTVVVRSSKIMVVFNQSLRVAPNLRSLTYLTSFNTSGFRFVYIMAKAKGSWQEGANFYIYAYDNNYGVQTYLAQLRIDTTAGTWYPSWGTGSAKAEIHSTKIDLYMHFYNSNVDFEGVLTIVVFLTK